MEDIERYGDYNEVDEAPGGNKNPVTTFLKILIVSLCILVVGVILFRVVLFNYYPEAMKTVYFNDELREYYTEHGGDLDAITQSMRAPYDDPDFASFMADNLIVIKDAGQIQLSVRYNTAIFDTIEKEYGIRLDKNSSDLFSFELERVPFNKTENPYTVGALDYVEYDSFLMYGYYKLVFDGVELYDAETSDWIRLKITINDAPEADPYYILVYENTDEYNKFSDYTLSKKERP